MKLAKHSNELKTNVKSESQNFGIGDASIVIEILRNRLYKHKIRTLVQEYISNGRDASREAGSKRDIKVVAPTRFEPTFKVRDFGNGISPDRIKNVFVLYGSSTKRDSNNQTGGFGIGAKSAWSYTDSFTIITYIDGIKRTYLAHTGLNNNGRLDSLGETDTLEPNGTEIQIGVSPDDISKFNQSILRAVHFWSESVELTGLDVSKEDLPRGLMVTNSIEIIDDNTLSAYNFRYDDNIVLAIDGILYPVDNSFYRGIFDTSKINGTVVLHISTGLIDVSASREEIAVTKENEAALKSLFSKAQIKVDNHINKKINSVSKISEKLKVLKELGDSFYVSYEKDGYKLSAHGKLRHDSFGDVSLIRYSLYRGKLRKVHIDDNSRSYSSRDSNIELTNLYYFDNTESIVKRNIRIREFLQTNNFITVLELKHSLSTTYNMFKKDLPFTDLKTLTYIEKPKFASVKVKRANTSFCVHSLSGYYGVDKQHTTLTTNTKKWYYIELTGMAFPIRKDHLRQIATKFNINVCGLSKASVARVKNDKNFIDFNSYLKTLKPTAMDIREMKFRKSTNDENYNYMVDMNTISNKKIKELGNVYQTFSRSKVNLPELLQDWYKNKEVINFMKKDAEIKALLKQCPLLTYINTYGTSKPDRKIEATLYINNKLKQLNKGSK